MKKRKTQVHMMRDDFHKYYDSEAESGKIIRIAKNHYTLFYGKGVDEGNENAVFVWRKDYDHLPTRLEAKTDVEALINGMTDKKILSGFVWKDNPVWLSSENQFNFKAAYDLAFQTNGASLPARYKLGEDEKGNPIYYDFQDLNTFADFYFGCIGWIQQCIVEGWKEKDDVDYDSMFGRLE